MLNLSGPLVALAVLALGGLLAGLYLIVERRRHRPRVTRVAERLPLFGTDQLAIRLPDGTAAELEQPIHDLAARPAATPRRPTPPRSTAAPDATRSAPTPRVEPLAPPVAPVAPAPPARPKFAPPPPPTAIEMPPPPRPRGEQYGQPTPLPERWSPPPSIGRPRPAGNGHPALGAAASVSAGALVVGEPSSIDAALIEGETLRFTVPTDGTVEFLPGRLEVVAGPDSGREIRFVRSPDDGPVEVTFGRSEGPVHRHVQILARTVSRRHAVLSLIDEHWQLTNASSTNPLVLNGRVLAANEVAPLLIEGDRIEMGEVVFVYHDA